MDVVIDAGRVGTLGIESVEVVVVVVPMSPFAVTAAGLPVAVPLLTSQGFGGEGMKKQRRISTSTIQP